MERCAALEGAARCGAGRRQALRGGWARQVPHRTGLLRASDWPGCTRGPQRPHRRSKLGLLALIHVFDLPYRQAEDGYPPFLWAAHLRRDKMGAYKKNERNIMVGTTHFRRFPAEPRRPHSAFPLSSTHPRDPLKPNDGEAKRHGRAGTVFFLHRDYPERRVMRVCLFRPLC